MQSGIGKLAAIICAQRQSCGGDLFFAKVTGVLALDDGCGTVIDKDDYAICSGLTLADNDTALCAWVDEKIVVIGKL